MARRVTTARSPHPHTDNGAEPAGRPLQPAASWTAENQTFCPVPSLKAIEQQGGPEVDGPLILPERNVWGSRVNELLTDFE